MFNLVYIMLVGIEVISDSFIKISIERDIYIILVDEMVIKDNYFE